MVDVLCGVMSGGRFNERVRKWSSGSEDSSSRTSSDLQEYIVTRKVFTAYVCDSGFTFTLLEVWCMCTKPQFSHKGIDSTTDNGFCLLSRQISLNRYIYIQFELPIVFCYCVDKYILGLVHLYIGSHVYGT